MFFYIMFSVTCLFIFQLDLYFSVIENSADGYRHFFSKLVYSWENIQFECTHFFGNMSYHSDERAFHNSLVASHHP